MSSAPTNVSTNSFNCNSNNGSYNGVNTGENHGNHNGNHNNNNRTSPNDSHNPISSSSGNHSSTTTTNNHVTIINLSSSDPTAFSGLISQISNLLPSIPQPLQPGSPQINYTAPPPVHLPGSYPHNINCTIRFTNLPGSYPSSHPEMNYNAPSSDHLPDHSNPTPGHQPGCPSLNMNHPMPRRPVFEAPQPSVTNPEYTQFATLFIHHGFHGKQVENVALLGWDTIVVRSRKDKEPVGCKGTVECQEERFKSFFSSNPNLPADDVKRLIVAGDEFKTKLQFLIRTRLQADVYRLFCQYYKSIKDFLVVKSAHLPSWLKKSPGANWKSLLSFFRKVGPKTATELVDNASELQLICWVLIDVLYRTFEDDANLEAHYNASKTIMNYDDRGDGSEPKPNNAKPFTKILISALAGEARNNALTCLGLKTISKINDGRLYLCSKCGQISAYNFPRPKHIMDKQLHEYVQDYISSVGYKQAAHDSTGVIDDESVGPPDVPQQPNSVGMNRFPSEIVITLATGHDPGLAAQVDRVD